METCLTTRKAVAIKLRSRPGLLVTAVVNYVKTGKETIIEVEPETLYGRSLPRTTFYVSEVEGVILPGVSYDDPMYIRLREAKRTYFDYDPD